MITNLKSNRVIVSMTKREAEIMKTLLSNITPLSVKSIDGLAAIKNSYLNDWYYKVKQQNG